MPSPISYNQDKFKELILYVSSQMRGQKFFGAVKLNKALFLSDFYSYALHGTPITGSPYRHLQLGPCPTYLVQAKRELVEAGDIEIIEDEVFGRKQNRILALRRADLSEFTSHEIKLIDEVLESILEKNGKELSDLTHELKGWILTEMGEDIPYHSIFIANRPASTFDVDQAKEILALTA